MKQTLRIIFEPSWRMPIITMSYQAKWLQGYNNIGSEIQHCWLKLLLYAVFKRPYAQIPIKLKVFGSQTP